MQDCQDGCPADRLKLSAGSCGCGRRRLSKAGLLLAQNATRAARGKRAKLSTEWATALDAAFSEQRVRALEAKQAAK